MSDHELREQVELTQVAAVVVASMEVAQFGQASFEGWTVSEDGGPAMQGFEILDTIAKERMRQDSKWGPQEHGREIWAMILAEEIGEWAEEIRVIQPSEEFTGYEATQMRAVLEYLTVAGQVARKFLEAHEWPDRQQEVFDAELVDEADSPAVVPGAESEEPSATDSGG